MLATTPNRPNIVKNFSFWGMILVIISIAFLSGCTSQKTETKSTETLPPEISVKKAATLRDGGAFMLDVRTQEEWDQGHIPGATHIPLDELETRVNEVPTDQEVVVYCRSGNRSQSGRDILTHAGYSQVTSMAGGITDWAANGFPVSSDQ